MLLPTRLSSLLLLSALAGGCASAPSPELAARWERADLARVEHRLQRSPQRLRDAALERWLVQQLQRIDPEHGADLRLYLLDLPTPQIDLIGDEVLRLRLSLLLDLLDEAELIFLLAHELAHRDLGHSAARRAPGWDADAAEIAADATAAAALARLGYSPEHGAYLLLRMRERTQVSEARNLLQKRVDALHRLSLTPTRGPPPPDVRFFELLAPYRQRQP